MHWSGFGMAWLIVCDNAWHTLINRWKTDNNNRVLKDLLFIVCWIMVLKYSKTTRSSLMMLEAGVSHCKNKKRREGNYNFLYSTCSFKYFPCLRCFNVLYCIPSFSAVILQLFLSFFSLTTCISVGPSCYCIRETFVLFWLSQLHLCHIWLKVYMPWSNIVLVILPGNL